MAATESTASPLLSMRAISKAFGGIPALTAASLEVAAGRSPCADRPERRRQIDDDQDPDRLCRPRRGRDRHSTAPRSKPRSPQDAQPKASARSTRKSISSPIARSPRTSVWVAKAAASACSTGRRCTNEARALLARFKIDIDVRQPLLRFNTATQQMVAIARAIGFKAKLVIMDEPTSSLDEREVAVLFDVIRQLKSDPASRSSSSATSSTSSMRSATASRSCATDERSEPPKWRTIGKLELVASMLGRDIAQVAKSATAFGDPARRIGDDVLDGRPSERRPQGS